MAQETNQTQGPMLCTTGCGFYGNPRTNGMCSVCYKDYLQRQNNNGRVSPSASSGVSTVGESLPVQLSDGAVVLLAPASSAVGSAQEPGSVVSSQTLLSQASVAHSEEEESAVDKAGLKTDQLQGPVESNAKCTIVDEQDGGSVEQACGPPSSGPLCEAVAKGLVENRKVRGKRKRRNAEQPLDGTHAPVLDGCDQTVVEDQGPSPNRPKKQKNRCFVCRKKVGLTGFDCRCGNVFCGIHRYTDMHECTFDYKAEAAEKIRKENPVVIAEKIHKI